jgi:hypothetical protein
VSMKGRFCACPGFDEVSSIINNFKLFASASGYRSRKVAEVRRLCLSSHSISRTASRYTYTRDFTVASPSITTRLLAMPVPGSGQNNTTELSGYYAWTHTLAGLYYGPGSVSTALPKLLSDLGASKALVVTGNSLYTKVCLTPLILSGSLTMRRRTL